MKSPIEPAPPMVTAKEIIDGFGAEIAQWIGDGIDRGGIDERRGTALKTKARTQLSDEVFAAIDRVRAKHPEGLGRQNACKAFEEEMRKFYGLEEV